MVPNGWVEKSLKDICNKTISYGIVQTGDNIENGVPCVRVVDLSKNTLNPIEMIKTSDEIHQSYKKTILCEGELMMALRGEIGLVKKVTPELIGANITRGLARLSPIKSVDSDYLLWTLRSNKIKNELARKSGGSALQEIALGSLRKVVLPIPPLPEQRKIAKILSTWDKAIATTEKLIDTSKQQKKALMQQLLTGKKRLVNPETGKAFEGEWEEVRLSEIAKVSIGLVTTMTKHYVESGVPLIRNSDIKQNEIRKEKMIYLSESFASESEHRKLKINDVVTVHTGEVGVSSVIGADMAGSLGFATLNSRPDLNKVLPIYLSWYFNSERFINWCVSVSTGDGRQNLNLKDFAKAIVLLPELAEQQKIASVLTAADKEIKVLEAKLANFKQEKKALMQQLLTGKRRVKIDKAEAA
ncbi:TPA: restriction endonuclease subunit S [Vibrio parahaemolyticus]|nr:restriction endonuclease subunit S [Vibrio parahaemolyticus]